MNKVCIYARVSTQEQGKKETIKTQIAKLKETYQKPIKEYQDVCSGAYLQRDGLNQMRDDAKKGLFDTIAIYSLDRLSRNLGHQIALLEEFEKQGIEIKVLGESFENSPEGMLNRNIRGAFAEYERYKIAQRMKDGKYRRAREGKVVASYPTFGYNLVKRGLDKYFEINPQEAKVVRLMFKIYLEEHSQRMTGRRLEAMGIKGRSRGKDSPVPINYRILSRYLRNETYIGNYYFGKGYFCEAKNPYKKETKTKLTVRKLKPRSEWIKIKVPAIIDKTTFARAQEILETRKKEYIRLSQVKHEYLCQGLIKCSKCDRRYHGGKHDTYKGKDYLFYRCPQKYKRSLRDDAHCQSRTISVEKLDTAVWQKINAFISQPNKVKKAVRLLREKRDNNKEFYQKIYNSLMVKKTKIKQQKAQLLDYYVEGKLLKEDLDNKLLDWNDQEKMFNQQIVEAKKDLARVDKLGVVEEEVEQLCMEYQEKLPNITFEIKKRIVRKWVKEINITDTGDIALKVRIPKIESKLIPMPSFIQNPLVEQSTPH